MAISDLITAVATIIVAAIVAAPGILAYRNQLKRVAAEKQKFDASASSELVQTSFELMERIKAQNQEIKRENQLLTERVDRHTVDILGLKYKVRELGRLATALIHQLHSHNIQPVSSLDEIVSILEEQNGSMKDEDM